ncbi:MAG: HEAT repeat domain-containing protein [Proteobacteria bacterium]|nr:HEAT repeat domain-containing protein [Pseudomonadota bacterium]
MNLKEQIRGKALELGFEDAGFTGVEPLDLYIREIESRPPEMYGWVRTESFNVRRGAAFAEKHPWARSLLVLIRNYHRRAFPSSMVGRIGRCYQVDERIERGDEHRRLGDMIDFLKGQGLRVWFDEEVPARMSAARAGIVTYGKNCFVYARNAMRHASWLESIPLILDAEIEPDEPSIELGCPSWCKNACIAACPTGALYSPGKMNPKRCIAYNSYYTEGITPLSLREPMGIWVYGCDRCQEVCPRNQPWMNQDLPDNGPLTARAPDFDLPVLLDMSDEHYVERVWPKAFYISRKNGSKWRMNAARALGNLGDREHVSPLARSLADSPDEIVRGMCAWALGRLGGSAAREVLEAGRTREEGLVRQEIDQALDAMG